MIPVPDPAPILRLLVSLAAAFVTPADPAQFTLDEAGTWRPARCLYQVANPFPEATVFLSVASQNGTCTPHLSRVWLTGEQTASLSITPGPLQRPAVSARPLQIADHVMIEAQQRIWGDINGDHAVDVADLLFIVASREKSAGQPGFDPAADLDGDGWVGGPDVRILAEHFGQRRVPLPQGDSLPLPGGL